MPSSRSRRKRSHKLLYSFLIIVLVLIAGYVATIVFMPLKTIYPSNAASPINSEGNLKVTWPNSQQASIGVLGTGTLVSNGPQTASPTASIAKLVTALAVLKKYPLSIGDQGPTYTITAADVADYENDVAEDGSTIPVVAGEQITEYQALQAMLLPSANNMADALAGWAYGSIPTYVFNANKLVKSLGMDSTVIADASGFSPSTVSTSTDLVKLGEATLLNPVLAQIVDQPSATLPIAGNVVNVDRFVGQDNLIGIKTGNTDQAGGNFLSAAKYDIGGSSIIVIGSVMKAPTLVVALNETIPMLQSVKDQLQTKTLPAGKVISNYYQPWGTTVTSVTKSAVVIPYLPGLPISYSNSSFGVKPPANSGSVVGDLIYSAGSTKNVTKVVLSSSLSKPSIFWKVLHPRYFF